MMHPLHWIGSSSFGIPIGPDFSVGFNFLQAPSSHPCGHSFCVVSIVLFLQENSIIEVWFSRVWQ